MARIPIAKGNPNNLDPTGEQGSLTRTGKKGISVREVTLREFFDNSPLRDSGLELPRRKDRVPPARF